MDLSSLGVEISLAIGTAAFIGASMIDHKLGLACPDVDEINVSGVVLFLHKCMYVGVGAGTTYLISLQAH